MRHATATGRALWWLAITVAIVVVLTVTSVMAGGALASHLAVLALALATGWLLAPLERRSVRPAASAAALRQRLQAERGERHRLQRAHAELLAALERLACVLATHGADRPDVRQAAAEAQAIARKHRLRQLLQDWR